MKIYRKTEEITDHGEKITVRDVDIDGVLYNLVIQNHRHGLGISFYPAEKCAWGEDDAPDYSISITGGNVTIGRHCFRPNHDHDDSQHLLIYKADKEATPVFFGTGGFDPNGKNVLLKIPFGGVKVEW